MVARVSLAAARADIGTIIANSVSLSLSPYLSPSLPFFLVKITPPFLLAISYRSPTSFVFAGPREPGPEDPLLTARS